MKNDKMFDLYSDYLISAFGRITPTGLFALLKGKISHDSVQRFLAEESKTSANLWRTVKSYTDENEIVCWHYDHSLQPNVKGINFVTCLYHNTGMSLPVGCEVIAKAEHFTDPKDGKAKRPSPKTKSEYYHAMTQQALRNLPKFKYVLNNDVWFSSAKNMKLVNLKKEFIMPLKANRKVAVSLSAKRNGHYQRVDTLEAMQLVTIYLEGVELPLLLLKQVFKNEDGATGISYLVTSDITLSGDDMGTLYQKRSSVEPYHKSLKQNASLEKSLTQRVTTQTNHRFASLCGFVKLEILQDTTKLNHFALKPKLYSHALQSAYATLWEFQPVSLAR
jgi:hypothetical protein